MKNPTTIREIIYCYLKCKEKYTGKEDITPPPPSKPS